MSHGEKAGNYKYIIGGEKRIKATHVCVTVGFIWWYSWKVCYLTGETEHMVRSYYNQACHAMLAPTCCPHQDP